MNSYSSDHCQEDEFYNEDDQDLYTPTSEADFRANIGTSINPRVIPMPMNTTEKHLTNPQKMEEVENFTESTSNSDQSMAIPRRWTDEWEAENVRNQKQPHCSNDDSVAEIERMRKKMQQLEEIVAKFQRQYENNQHKATFRNDVKSDIEIIEIDDDDEQTEVKQECGQANNDSTEENENLRNKVQKLENNLAEIQSQLEQLRGQNIQLYNKTIFRDAVKSEIDVIEIDDDDNEQTEVKQECQQTSNDVVLQLDRSHNIPTIDQTSAYSLPNPADDLVLTDCQPTLSSVIRQQSDVNDEPTEDQQVATNDDLSHFTNINLYQGAISAVITESECEVNTTGRFHGTIEEAQDSDVTHITMSVTDQVITNSSTQLSEQNEDQFAVGSIASGDITASAIILPNSEIAEIPRSKRSKMPNNQTESRTSNSRIVPQEPLQDEEISRRSRFRGRKRIHNCDFDELTVERKRGRRSYIEENLPEIENETGDEEGECGLETEEETLPNNARPGSETDEKRFKCGECSYSAKYKHHLLTHRRTHTGEKPHKCSQCLYASAHSFHLTIHMRTHTGEKPYKCKQCSYTCAVSTSLKLHMRTHTGEKPYKCSQCSFATAQSGHLKIHIRTHTGEKPYKCNQCSFASVCAGDLKIHMRTHTGEKPYKCRQCSFASAQPGRLNAHIRSHTGEKPYKCIQCSYASAETGTLRNHMRTHI